MSWTEMGRGAVPDGTNSTFLTPPHPLFPPDMPENRAFPRC